MDQSCSNFLTFLTNDLERIPIGVFFGTAHLKINFTDQVFLFKDLLNDWIQFSFLIEMTHFIEDGFCTEVFHRLEQIDSYSGQKDFEHQSLGEGELYIRVGP